MQLLKFEDEEGQKLCVCVCMCVHACALGNQQPSCLLPILASSISSLPPSLLSLNNSSTGILALKCPHPRGGNGTSLWWLLVLWAAH